MDFNPAHKVKLYKENPMPIQPLSLEEETRLIDFSGRADLAPHLKPVILLALDAGMRLGEILNLKWVNIDLEKRIITLTKTKEQRNPARPHERRGKGRFRGLESSISRCYICLPQQELETLWVNKNIVSEGTEAGKDSGQIPVPRLAAHHRQPRLQVESCKYLIILVYADVAQW